MNHLNHSATAPSLFDRPVSSFLSKQSALLSSVLLQSACDFLVARMIDLLWITFDLDESIPSSK